jgi:hypothetical protein
MLPRGSSAATLGGAGLRSAQNSTTNESRQQSTQSMQPLQPQQVESRPASRQISSIELNPKFVHHPALVLTGAVGVDAENSMTMDLLPMETPSMGESLLNRLCKDPYVGTFLICASVVWPELTADSREATFLSRCFRLGWWLLLRICGATFLFGIIALSIYEEVEYDQPMNINIINYSLSIVSVLQVVSLYPVLYICNEKLRSKASDESIPICLYRRALVPSAIFFGLVCLSSVILIAFDCYADPPDLLTTLNRSLRWVQAIFQVFLGGVLAVNLMFVFADSYVQSAAMDDLIQQIKLETMTVETLESIRQNLKRNQLSSYRINSVMSLIAIVNLFFFVMSMYFIAGLDFGACVDTANITLVFSLFFKEILYLMIVLLAAAQVNEHADTVITAAGSVYSSTSELQLTRAVIYISLQTQPLSYTILGMRPTYTKLALECLTFVVASIVGLGRTLAEKSAS